MMNDKLFGKFLTNTFSEVFPDMPEFKHFLITSGINIGFKEENTIDTLYYLLYARYGNSHIINTDVNQFKYKLASIVFMYGPTWEKRLEVQRELRALSIEILQEGSTATYNTALNPGYLQSIDSQATQKINSQNKTIYKKSKTEAYATIIGLLETDVTEEFISKFRKLFIQIVAPAEELTYATTPEEQSLYES